MIEIIFNHRLTQQARLLWLWLTWIHPQSRQISWADCEQMMACGTKARRNCLSQLVTEGFVTVDDNGVVIVHDPYEAYHKSHDDYIPSVNVEFEVDEKSISKPEDNIDTHQTQTEKTTANSDPQPKKSILITDIIDSWNEFKPKSYSKIRTVSAKQLEAVNKHLKNLNHKNTQVSEFIRHVCKGIERSDFWSNKIDQSGRNFSAVFGYGNPQDVKLKNVENLYILGQEDADHVISTVKLNDDDQELVDAYTFISFEYKKARNRNNIADIEKWQAELEEVKQRLQEQNIQITT
ncbi:MAG: hypothetical protein ACO24P_00210 [Candidatus Nanopelagicaceae bacterium]